MPVYQMNGVALLTEFSCKIMYGRFARTNKSGHNYEVTVRRVSSVTAKALR